MTGVGPGTVFLIGGINDSRVIPGLWRRGLRQAGLPHRTPGFRWQQGMWARLCYADLWRTAVHRRAAADLADRLRHTLRDHPGEPLHAMAHSAGAAVVAYALAELGSDEAITSAVLCSPGVSTGFDLGPTADRCRAGVLVVTSRLDWLTLGFGTTVLGTADRRWGPAAGMVGFRRPADPAVAAKVRRVDWRPRHVGQGWLGGHLSVAAPGFVRATLAGWVRQAEAEAGR